MHIGRAQVVHTEPMHHQVQATLDLTAENPVVAASRSIPTGESASQLPHYNPVTDLIQRHAQTSSLPPVPPPPEAAASSYVGTPPTPSIIDLRA